MPTTTYRTKNGKRVPGVTTVAGVFDGGKSRALMSWAADLGLKGIDARNYRDRAAIIGTAAHAICTAHVVGTAPELPEDLAPEELAQAEQAALSFFEWLDGHDLDAKLVEAHLVHEDLRYGGTPDIYGVLDGVPTLIDIKTSKSIYAWDPRGVGMRLKGEYALQVGGYSLLLKHHRHQVERAIVLGISKGEDYAFDVYEVQDLEGCEQGFLLCRFLYDAQRRLQ